VALRKLEPKTTVAAKWEIDATLLRIFTIFGWIGATSCAYTNVTSKRRERHDYQQTTLTRQTISLFFDTNRSDFADTQADPAKKIKTPHRTKRKMNFFCHPTFCTFGFAPTHKDDPSAKPKEQNFPTARVTDFKLTCIFDNSVQNNLSK